MAGSSLAAGAASGLQGLTWGDGLSGAAKLQNVQILRAVAAFAVVLCHGSGENLRQPAPEPLGVLQFLVEKCLFGVDIFFVISGFIMFYISRTKVAEPGYPAKFFLNRIFRIVPLYWLVTTLMICISLLAPGLKHTNSVQLDYVLASYFFIPMNDPVSGLPQPLVGLGWTLNAEMFFYVLFAISMIVFARRALIGVVGMILVIFLIGTIPAVQQHQHDFFLAGYTHSMILEFMFGIIIAQLFATGRFLPKLAGPVCMVLGVALWTVGGPENAETGEFLWRGLVWGIPAALIVGGAILGLRETKDYTSAPIRFAVAVGDASYSLYLTHLFVMRPVTMVLGKTGLTGLNYTLVFFAIFIPAAIGVALLCYRYFELPTHRLGQRLVNGFRTEKLSSA